ncbi:hypothetical protein PFISCL1PPCAC_26736, partial [Pristionchus fissidentatus]
SGICQPSILLFLLSLLIALVSTKEVIEFIPDRQLSFALSPTSGTIEKRQISVKGEVRLKCVGPGQSLSWQYQEGLKPPKGVVEIVEDDARFLDFEVFDEKMDGLYSCMRYDTNEKKRIRLFFFDDVIPNEYHECSAEQKAQCIHAKACRAADGTNHLSCVCMRDWHGEKCDTPILDAQPNSSINTGMPLLWIIFSLICLVAIVIAVKCHNDDEKSVLVPTTDPAEMV